jgi:HK97 family phage major capsid protein
MSKDDFSSVSLSPLKVGALTAISIELLEDSSPSAMQLVQDSLIADSAQLIDTTFFSASAASAGVSPAGIVNGVAGTASAGTDAQGVVTDLDVLTQAFITAKNTGGLKYVSRPALAQKISGFLSFASAPIFPGLSEVGGTLQQKPYLTSDNVVSGDLLLIKPQDIFRIGDRGLSIDVSRDATLEFASDPTGSALGTPVAQSKQPVNLFASGMIGVRLIRRINWAKRRSSAVARITGAAYVPMIQTA